MQVELLKSMPNLVAECVRLHLRAERGQFRKEDGKQLDELQRVFPAVFSLLSSGIHLSLSADAQCDPNQDQPGYVVFRVGDLRVFVPFFLANIFPHGELLQAICNVGARLQVGTDSVICISGSGCQLGLDLPVGDLDFCEYLPNGDTSIAQRLFNKLVEQSPDALCFRMVLGNDKVWLRPWTRGDKTGDEEPLLEQLRAALSAAAFRQCQFVANVPNVGVLEATNVLLMLDFSSREAAEAARSFAGQKVPIAPDGWTPRELASPLALGRYVAWLVDSAAQHCSDSTAEPRSIVKATRRALSVTRLLFLGEESRRLVQLLDDGAARLAALHDRCRLFGAISCISDDALQAFTVELRRSISQLRGLSDVMDTSLCAALTSDEVAELGDIRDKSLPVVSDVLARVKRTLGIDLLPSRNLH